jgi:hypothetical protein
MRPKPLGLVLLGVLAGLLGAVLLVFFLVLSDGGPLGLVAWRAGLALVGAISLVAAEALICLRPWFYRASFWLVASFCAMIVAMCVGLGGAEGIGMALTIIALLLAFLIPILFYVRDEARLMAARPARRPHPVPRRVP